MIMPTFFLSHGGGPWPWMTEEMPGVFEQLQRSLEQIPSRLPAPPKAILVITAHWIERDFAISGHAKPPMIYDFSGFPEHTYQVRYDAAGLPALAAKIELLLKQAELPTHIDFERGFDHGTYTPLFVMYPKADVPIVQLSIHMRFDPETHLKVGRVLAPLRQEGILIVGSGLSYHNLGSFGKEVIKPSQAFDRWLQTTVAEPPEQRSQQLINWSSAPFARHAHPKEDHLLPLMVALGAAEHETASLVYHEERFMGSWCVSSFQFGK